MRTSWFAAIAAALACAGPAWAAERLAPEGSAVLADYEAQVTGVLKGAFDPDVRVRAVFEPAFSPEFAVGLRGRPTARTIFVLEPSRQIWGYHVAEMMKAGQIEVWTRDGKPGTADAIRRIQKDLPPRPEMLMVSRCEVAIDPGLADRIADAWRAMLLDVRAGERLESGLDGEFVRFSMDIDGKTRGGVIWSPGLDTRPGQLVTAAREMRNYCRGRKPESLAAVEKAVAALGRSAP